MGYSHLNPGEELEVSRRVYFERENAELTELVTFPLAELLRQMEESEALEKAIYEKLAPIVNEWDRQAHTTLNLRKAMEYCKTLPVNHTSNQWKEAPYDWHEISNMVYKMEWRVYERTQYDHAVKKTVTVSYDLSWYVVFNAPRNSDVTGHGWRIAGQDRKPFKEKSAMEKYLQGRIQAYAHLFTEISPPIPYAEQGRFSVNGVLLPGYTVEAPERTPQEVAAELLDCLDDGDYPSQETPKEPPTAEPVPPSQKSTKSTVKKKSAPKKSGLVR